MEEIKAGQIIEYDKDNTPHFIIDGVDVSDCKYFQIAANTIYPKAHYCGSTFNRFCEDDENCVYKQLKRLEFENKLLKADYEASEEENKKLKEKNKLLEKISTHLTDNSLFSVRHFKKENAKLKESNENLLRRLSTKMLSDEHYDIRRLEVENLGLAEENKKLKEALEEIREINITCLEFKTCKNCKFLKICSNMGTGSYIVNKINEVLKDE